MHPQLSPQTELTADVIRQLLSGIVHPLCIRLDRTRDATDMSEHFLITHKCQLCVAMSSFSWISDYLVERLRHDTVRLRSDFRNTALLAYTTTTQKARLLQRNRAMLRPYGTFTDVLIGSLLANNI